MPESSPIGSRSAEQSLCDHTIKDPNWKPGMKMKENVEYPCLTRR